MWSSLIEFKETEPPPSTATHAAGPVRVHSRWFRPAIVGAAGIVAILIGGITYRSTRRAAFARKPDPGARAPVAKTPPQAPASPLKAGRPTLVEVARLSVGHFTQTTAISPDGRQLVTGHDNIGTAILWDWESARRNHELPGHGGRVMSVAFSPDGHRALSGDQDGVVRLWNVDSGRLIKVLGRHEGWVLNVAFSPDGRVGYSSGGGEENRDGRDSAVRVWDLDSRTLKTKLEGHKGRVCGLAVSLDGQKILTGGDTTLILWDAQGRKVSRVSGHGGLIRCVALLSDGRRAVSSSDDMTIRLWDLDTREEVRKFGDPNTVASWLSVSVDGRLLLSAHKDRAELRLWDVDTGKLIRTLHWLKNSWDHVPTRGSFAPDGTHVVWGTGNGYAWIYRLEYREEGQHESKDIPTHYTFGRTLARQGKLDQAIAEYREAIRIRPEDAPARRELGKVLSDQGKYEDAIAEYREAIRLDPDDPVTHHRLGWALDERGKGDEAIAEYREAIRLDPKTADSYNNLAMVLLLSPTRPRRDHEEGMAHARRAVELKRDYFALNTLALAEYRLGHWNESIATSEQSMAANHGGNAWDWFLMGLCSGRRVTRTMPAPGSTRRRAGPSRGLPRTGNFSSIGRKPRRYSAGRGRTSPERARRMLRRTVRLVAWGGHFVALKIGAGREALHAQHRFHRYGCRSGP